MRLTPADIRQRAENIEHNAATVRWEVENLQTLLAGLLPSFSGNRSSSFSRAFERERTTISQWEQIVRCFAEELRAVAARTESVQSD